MYNCQEAPDNTLPATVFPSNARVAHGWSVEVQVYCTVVQYSTVLKLPLRPWTAAGVATVAT